MERNQIAYINYKKWSVRYDLTDSTFRVKLDGMGDVIRDAHIVSICSARNPQPDLEDYVIWILSYQFLISMRFSGFRAQGKSRSRLG